jgi:hypothetical protein
MVLPGSALISFRRMVRPAPLVVLYRSLSACRWTADEACLIASAWPKPSETPNPAIL